MKIGILEHDQAPGEAPRHTLNSSKAQILVRARWANELSEHRFQMIVAYSWATVKAALRPKLSKAVRLPSSYIPDTLPQMEVPGCVFREPISAMWRRDPESRSLAVRALPADEVFGNMHAIAS